MKVSAVAVSAQTTTTTTPTMRTTTGRPNNLPAAVGGKTAGSNGQEMMTRFEVPSAPSKATGQPVSHRRAVAAAAKARNRPSHLPPSQLAAAWHIVSHHISYTCLIYLRLLQLAGLFRLGVHNLLRSEASGSIGGRAFKDSIKATHSGSLGVLSSTYTEIRFHLIFRRRAPSLKPGCWKMM